MKSNTPKVLHALCGKPMLSWVIDAVAAAGIGEDVVVVVGHGAEAVTGLLRAAHGSRVRSVVQEQQRGTGHAVQVAMAAVAENVETVLVLCGDTPRVTAESLAQLVALRATSSSMAALWTTELDNPHGYGRIVRNEAGHVSHIVEEKDTTSAQRTLREVNPGVYCFAANFLRQALPKLSTDNAAGELYLTDVVGLAAREGRVVTLPVDAAITHGVNDRVQLAAAERFLAHRIIEKAMRAGATVHDPDSVLIGPDVELGIDVDIGPRVILMGTTRLDDGVTVGPGSVLVDSEVKGSAVIHAYSLLQQAVVGPRASVGPFARLRPGTEVGEDAHVGNFVELKKTRLGKGSKANHLAYLGDADIGAAVNVGAGTITCNYDGVSKHVTTIEDGVFVGSNATLVAPVVLGTEAYIAAGSVVTEMVPGGSVAFGRARQTNKQGHAAIVRGRNAARATPAAPKKKT